MIKDKKLSCTNLKKPPSQSGGCCKPELQGGLALSKETQGQSVPPCIAFTSKSSTQDCTLSQYPKGTVEPSVCTWVFLLPLLQSQKMETPHGSSTFLTTFIDILMGPPLINTWIKTNYLLSWPHVKNAQKSALSSHSRSISTFSITPCVLVIY